LAALSSAGPDQRVEAAASVKLNGSNSIGSQKRIARYQWTQIDGPPVYLSRSTAIEPVFVAPDNVGPDGSSLTFQLTVTGKDGSQSKDSCFVNVTWENEPPVADAGPNQTVASGELVTLDGSRSSDSADGIASYLWQQMAGCQVALSDPAVVFPTFVAPDVWPENEVLIFQLTVTDQGGLRAKDTCIINVTSENQPPKADAGENLSVRSGARVMLDGSKSADPDGNIVSYRWTQLTGQPVKLSDPGAIRPSFMAPLAENADDLVFQLTVTDSEGLRDKQKVVVKVNRSLKETRP
jgi:hypothetical protein